jgi:hypothetical protein
MPFVGLFLIFVLLLVDIFIAIKIVDWATRNQPNLSWIGAKILLYAIVSFVLFLCTMFILDSLINMNYFFGR